MPGIPYNTLTPNKGFFDITKRENFQGSNTKQKCSKHNQPVVVDEKNNKFIVGKNTHLTRVCPHNGCLLSQEGKEFVCPCHRSKFDKCGNCLEGPACPNSILLNSEKSEKSEK